MAVMRESPFASRTSRIVLGATIAFGLVAAVAAAPTAPASKVQSAAAVQAAVSVNDDGMRPLAHGPAIRVGRAYGAEDEDCTLVLKPSTDEHGRVRYMRSVTCTN
ncbi:hypothetical protein [Methylocystis parvus]|uniref:Surface antigen domain-containing protein n=1 Tax=Methylocystis parvus TaxID=134 RepID=A0A6B8M2E2_9HYPH|nr:hypothetical protein [Methylocystis parvus]QGM97031.1 hypothetical protein F7D14_05780 [Methylocystis parvus]WBJ99074.1 hypothetical protein MMG94_13835 [Methylocystis parvus OBBP]